MGTKQLPKPVLKRLSKEMATLRASGKRPSEIAAILNAAGATRATGQPLDGPYVVNVLHRVNTGKASWMRAKRAVKPAAEPFTRLTPKTQADEILAIITLPVSQKIQRKLLQAYLSEEQ